MPVNLNFIVKKGNHSAPSSILQTTQNFKLQGIKYIKKQDKSQGANTYMQLLRSKIDEIATLRSAGATQIEIAKQLGVSRYFIQKFFRDYLPDAIPKNRKFIKAVKTFFLSNNAKEKNKAFEVVDKVLQKIAKEQSKLNKNEPYEDLLQNLRLSFINTANRNAKNKNFDFYGYVNRLKQKSLKVKSEKQVQVPLSTIENDGKYIAKTDANINEFEDQNYKFHQIHNSGLTRRECMLAELLTFQNRTLNELEEHFWLTSEHIKNIINNKISPKMEQFKDQPKY